eukprot:6186570-Amphidinium_carterae.1
MGIVVEFLVWQWIGRLVLSACGPGHLCRQRFTIGRVATPPQCELWTAWHVALALSVAPMRSWT